MDNCYRVIFRGDVAHGFKVADVKEKITSLLNEDPETIDTLFSGKTLIIKKDPNLEKCEKIRKIFLAVGAVCYIEDPENQIKIDLDAITEDSSQKKKAPKRSIKFADVTGKLASVKPVLASSKEKIQEKLKQAYTSIKTDLQIGDMKILFRNKYFLTSLSICVAVLLLVIVSFTYQGKAMPLTKKNYSQLFNHIIFVEKAFTPVELEGMKKNPADYYEYLLIEPIEKMGYEFEASISSMSVEFLDDGFNAEEKNRAITLLKLITPERDKLFSSGLISEGLKNSLEKASKKIGV